MFGIFNRNNNPNPGNYNSNISSTLGVNNESRYGYVQHGTDLALRGAIFFDYFFTRNRKSDDSYDPYLHIGHMINKEEVERLEYMKYYSRDRNINPNVELNELARIALANNAFTSLSTDLYNLTLSGTKVINRIINKMTPDSDLSSLSPKEREKRARELDKYAASNIYRYLFAHDTYEVAGKKIFKNLNIMDTNLSEGPSEYGGDYDGIAEGRWLMNNILKSEERSMMANVNKIHQELLLLDRERLSKSRKGVYSSHKESIKQLSERIINDKEYVSKPGIREAIAFIESADKELTIDLFQLQNKAISDVLINKLEREKKRIAKGDFKFKLRLASPTNSNSENLVGHHILGPNIIIMQRLGNLRDDILYDQIGYGPRNKNMGEIDPFFSNNDPRHNSITDSERDNIERVLSDSFSLEFIEDGRYHPKLFTSDKVAMVGSFNLTSPVGSSIFQSGSNYEEIHILRNRINIDYKKSEKFINNYVNDKLNVNLTDFVTKISNKEKIKKYGSKKLTPEEREEVEKDRAESLLYMQARILARIGVRSETGGSSITGMQIGKAGDIGQALRASLSFLKSNSNRKDGVVSEIYMNLNQTWILQYDNDLYYGSKGDYSGEFGPSSFTKKGALDELLKVRAPMDVTGLEYRRYIYRNEVQKNLFDLITEGRAFISVDHRNYREKIITPMEEKVNYLLGRREIERRNVQEGVNLSIDQISKNELINIGKGVLLRDFDGSMSYLVNSNKNEDNLRRVLGLTSSKNQKDRLDSINYYNSSILFEGRTDLSTQNHIHETSIRRTIDQLKAITSGSIVPVTETMSHVKNFMVIERNRGSFYDPATGKGINALSYVSGSSNFGSTSLAFEEADEAFVSSESGLILIADKLRKSKQAKSQLKDKDVMLGMTDRDEEIMLKARAKYPIREWKRLTESEMGKFDYLGDSTKSIWEDRVSRQGLEDIKINLERINRDIGSNAVNIIPSYNSKGELTYYTIKFSTGSITGSSFNSSYMGNDNQVSYRVTVLKDIKGQPGFVYMIDQNKVLGNTRLINTLQEDIYGIPYGLKEGEKYRRIESGQSIEINPIDTFTNLLSTLMAEVSYRSLVEEPLRYMKSLSSVHLESDYSKDSGFSLAGLSGLGYLKYLGTGNTNKIEGNSSEAILKYFQNLSSTEAHEIKKQFYSRHLTLTKEGKRSLEMSAGLFNIEDMNDSRVKERHSIIFALDTISSLNEEINKSKISSSELGNQKSLIQKRNESILFLLTQFENILGREDKRVFESDISLGIIESLRDLSYYSERDNNIRQIKKSLFEPFITLGQASIYANSQAWYRNTLYSISSYSLDYFREGVSISEQPSLMNIMRYALGSPYLYSASDTIGEGAEAFIRNVAQGGGGSGGEAEGYSIFGGKKLTTGEVYSIDILKYTGTGNIVYREDYMNSITRKLYAEYINNASLNISNITFEDFKEDLNKENSLLNGISEYKKIFNQLISKTPFDDESVDKALVFNFNIPKKASQIPQRLKNVLGSKPMYEMDSGFSTLLRKKGVLQGTEIKSFKKFLEDKHKFKKTNLQKSFDKVKNLKDNTYNISPDQYLEALLVNRQIKLINKKIKSSSAPVVFKSKRSAKIVQNVIGSMEQDIFNIGVDSFINYAEDYIWNDPSNKKGYKEKDRKEAFSIIKELYKEVNELVGESTKIALINDSDIRNYMTTDQHEIIETLKDNISEIYGFTRDEYLEHGSLARSILLTVLRTNDTLASGIKGFTSGRTTSDGKKSVILVQLSGAFSDYGFANPLYGTEKQFLKEMTSRLREKDYKNPLTNKEIKLKDWSNLSREDKLKVGMMSGFMEKAEKRQKSSMLMEDWYVQGGMVAKKGDIVTYDIETNRVLVWGEKSGLYNSMVPLDKIDMEKVSKVDRDNLKKAAMGDANYNYYLKESVDSRDQVSAVAGVIDNFRVVNDLPSVSLLERQAWHRNSEESYEYLISAKQLAAVADTNQLIWEFTYNRSLMMGGGRRVESPTGLLKSVNVFLEGSLFERLALELNEYGGGTLKKDPLSVENIMGLYNPSNLKSYMFGHGSEILSRVELREYFFSQLGIEGFKEAGVQQINNEKLSTLMLLTFGDSFLEGDTKSRVYSKLFESSLSGRLGDWMKGLALSTILSSGELITPNISEITNLLSGGSLGIDSDLRKGMVKSFENILKRKSGDLYSAMETPFIKMINPESFESAMTSPNSRYLQDFLTRQLSQVKDLKRDYILGDVIEERMAAIMVGNLELMSQLMEQKEATIIPTDINVKDNKVLLKLLSISGYQDISRLENIITRIDYNQVVQQEEREYLESMREVLRGLTNVSNVVRLYGSSLPSQSKEPVGSKTTGGLEFQHLVKPLYQFSSTFKESGDLAALRKIVGSVLATVSQTESMITGETILRKNDLLVSRPVDISEMNSLSAIDRHKFIGISTSYDPEGIKELRKLKRSYQDYEDIIRVVIEDKVKQLDNLKGDSKYEKLKRLELTSEITDLLTLQPDYLYEGKTHYMDEKIEYLTVKWHSSSDGTIKMKEASQTSRVRGIFGRYIKEKKAKRVKTRRGSFIDIMDTLDNVSGRAAIDIGRVQQALNIDTPFGMGTIQPVLEGLNYKGFSFSLPSYVVEGQNDIGGISLEFDFSEKSKRYSYLMGKNELELLGDQYGSYVEELTAKTIYLASAFAPGTELSIIIDKIKRANISGHGKVSLTKEQYTLWQRYYETAVGSRGIVPILAESSANVRSQQVMAGKVRIEGIVTTPAASFLVNPGDIILAEEAERRQIHMSRNRYDLYQEAVHRETKYKRFFGEDLKSGMYGKEVLASVIEYYSSLKDAMLYGLSEPATINLKVYSEEFKKVESSINNLKDNEFLRRINDISKDISNLRYMDLSLKSEKAGRGDAHLNDLKKISSIYLRNKIETRLYNIQSTLSISEKNQFRKDSREIELTLLETDIQEAKNYVNVQKLNLDNSLSKSEELYNIIKPISKFAESKLEIIERLRKGQFSSSIGTATVNPDGTIKRSYDITSLYDIISQSIIGSKDSQSLFNEISRVYSQFQNLDIFTSDNKINSNFLPSSLSKNSVSLQQLNQSISDLRNTNKNDLRVNSALLTDHQKGLASLSLEVAQILNDNITDILAGKASSVNPLTSIDQILNKFKDYGNRPIESKEFKLYQQSLDKLVKDIEQRKKLNQKYNMSDISTLIMDNINSNLTQINKEIASKNNLLSEANKLVTKINNNQNIDWKEYNGLLAALEQNKYTDPQITDIYNTIKSQINSIVSGSRRFLHQSTAKLLQNIPTLSEGVLGGNERFPISDFELEGKLRKRVSPFKIERELLSGKGSYTRGSYSEEDVSFLTYYTQKIYEEFKTVNKHLAETSKKTHKSTREYSGIVKKGTNDSFKKLSISIKSIGSALKKLQGNEQVELTESHINRILGVYELGLSGIPETDVEIKKRIKTARDLMLRDPSKSRNAVDAYGLISLLEQVLNTYDATETMQVLGFRSPPPGGNEQQRYTLEVLKDISLINEYSRAINPQGGIEYDKQRNKTLTLLSPISLLTMGLGDFDGDPYTTIYSNFMELHRDVYNTEAKIKFKEEVQLKKLQDSIQANSRLSSVSLNKKDITDFIKNNASSLNESEVSLLNKWISKSEEINKHKKDISVTNLKIKAMNRELTASSFNKALRTEISNYIGINKKYFTSIDDGGYVDSDVSTDLMLTFIEQGRGLFGGIQEKAPEAVRVNDLMKKIFTDYTNPITPSGSTTTIARGGYDLAAFNNILDSSNDFRAISTLDGKIREAAMAQTDPNKAGSLYSLLLLSQESFQNYISSGSSLSSDYSLDYIIQELRKSRNFLENEGKLDSTTPLSEKDVDDIIAYTSARSMTQASSMEGLRGIMAQASGTSMDFKTSEMMVLTMGKAGSDVLGKIYNTFIGAIYRDSPISATAHILTEGGFIDTIRNSTELMDTIALEGLTVDDFVSELTRTKETTDSLHGFIKNINQLLRDGIKPKGGADFLSNLRVQAENYANLNTKEEKDALVAKIASSFGPKGSEVGLIALMELSNLEEKRDILLSSSSPNTISVKQLNSGSGVSSTSSLITYENNNYALDWRFQSVNSSASYDSFNSDINAVSKSLKQDFGLSSEQFERLAVEIHKNTGRESISAFEVAALKTVRDLQGLIISYEYANLMETSLLEQSSSPGSKKVLEGVYGRYLQEGLSLTNKTDIVSNLESFRNSTISPNQINDFDNWVKSKIQSDSRIGYIGSRILGITEDQFNISFTQSSNPHMMKNRAIFLAMAETGLTATAGMMGEYGEGMMKFTTLETTRKKTSSLLSGSKEYLPDDVLGSDLWMTVMNLMSSDKLKPHAAAAAFNIIADAERLFDSPENVLVSLISGIDQDGNVMYNQGTDTFTQKGAIDNNTKFRRAMRAMLTNNNLSSIEVEGTIFESEGEKNAVFNYLSTMLEESTTQIRHKALEDFIKKATGREDLIFGDPSEIINSIIDTSKLTPEQKKSFENQLSFSLEELRYEKLKRYTGESPILTKNNTARNINQQISRKLSLEAINKAQEQSNTLSRIHDLVLPGLLSIVGSSILSGRLDEEVLGDIVGGTILSIGYMKQSRVFTPSGEELPSQRQLSSREGQNNSRGILKSIRDKGTDIVKGLGRVGVGALAAGKMKVEIALNQHEGDYGAAIAHMIGTEVGFMLGSNLVSPMIEAGALKLATGHIDAMHTRMRNYETARLSPGQRMDYLTKGTSGVLDIDNVSGIKSTFSTLGSAILSGLMGLASSRIGGNVAVELLNSNGDFSEIAIIDNLINSVQKSREDADRAALLREDNPDVTDEFGNPINSSIEDISLLEEYASNSISPDDPISIEQLLNQEAAYNGEVIYYG